MIKVLSREFATNKAQTIKIPGGHLTASFDLRRTIRTEQGTAEEW